MCFFFPSGLDYKKLIAVGSPLQILKPVLTSANVHLLAKLANKIPTQVSEVVCRVRSLCLSRLLKTKKDLSFSHWIPSPKSYLPFVFCYVHTRVIFWLVRSEKCLFWFENSFKRNLIRHISAFVGQCPLILYFVLPIKLAKDWKSQKHWA